MKHFWKKYFPSKDILIFPPRKKLKKNSYSVSKSATYRDISIKAYKFYPHWIFYEMSIGPGTWMKFFSQTILGYVVRATEFHICFWHYITLYINLLILMSADALRSWILKWAKNFVYVFIFYEFSRHFYSHSANLEQRIVIRNNDSKTSKDFAT